MYVADVQPPPHPGEVLQEWLSGITTTQAAASLGVTRVHLSRILHGHVGVTADMALRLGQALNTSAEMWLGLQLGYDLWQAQQRPMPEVESLVAR